MSITVILQFLLRSIFEYPSAAFAPQGGAASRDMRRQDRGEKIHTAFWFMHYCQCPVVGQAESKKKKARQ